MTLNRFTSLIWLFFSCAMIFYIIPQQTEVVDYGWVKPDSIPKLTCYLIGLLALLQFVFDRTESHFELREALKVSLFLSIGLAALYAMSYFGFIVVAPLLSLMLMVLVGEKRAIWLISTVLIVPGVIWMIVVMLLERQLP